MLRTHNLWEISLWLEWQEVKLTWWIDTIRDLWWAIFLVLRDRYGKLQINCSPDIVSEEIVKLIRETTHESVIQVIWKIKKRPENMINSQLSNWDIELIPEKIIVLSKANLLPFEVNKDQNVNEDLRLEYRYLDLRRTQMLSNIETRNKITNFIMNFFQKEKFLYIETPTFIKNTPEWSREYIVPVRTHPWKFFVLPQSPQQLKQISMVAGLDRYFQLARCYRDEDLRWDRQPEFTQLDLEMSFVEQSDVMSILEKHFIELTSTLFPDKKMNSDKFEILSREECVNSYWSDKPDLRVKSMKLFDLTNIAHQSSATFLQSAKFVKWFFVNKIFSRSDIDNKFTPQLIQKWATWLAYLTFEWVETKWSAAKFFTPEQITEFKNIMWIDSDWTIFFQAGSLNKTNDLLGFLRTILIKELNLIDPNDQSLGFWFVIDFPLFELDEETGELAAAHHPFTKPKDADIPFLQNLWQEILKWKKISDEDKVKLASLRADCYDVILNGYELWSGSIRITDPVLQQSMFALLWLSESQIENRFWHLLKAFSFWVPPHWWFAYWLDRVVMIYQNMPNIREVIPYPKNTQGFDPMLNAPSEIDEKTLKELWL